MYIIYVYCLLGARSIYITYSMAYNHCSVLWALFNIRHAFIINSFRAHLTSLTRLVGRPLPTHWCTQTQPLVPAVPIRHCQRLPAKMVAPVRKLLQCRLRHVTARRGWTLPCQQRMSSVRDSPPTWSLLLVSELAIVIIILMQSVWECSNKNAHVVVVVYFDPLWKMRSFFCWENEFRNHKATPVVT